ncbi:MAG: HU family DNA-binding protein [Dysgonamonadaceae bacterium]|jgi:nucleoid DNA-binding protein/nucleoid-associated protein YgaU|nr:HU family DNA-binding protein [Dysgonamonadaceae bacterium]
MNEKINLQDLSALLAEKSSINQKEAESFLREFIETVQEALLSEESVRIKNLGTFKRLTVSDRESVDVTTGNRMLIPAHYKINFTPDNGLANAVNEPFAFFDTIELDDTAEPSDTEKIEKLPSPEENRKDEKRQIKIEEPPVFKKNESDSGRPKEEHSSAKHRRRRRSRQRRKKRLLISSIYLLIIATLAGFLGYLYIIERADASADFALTNGTLTTNMMFDVAAQDSIVTDSITVNDSITVSNMEIKDTVTKTPPAIIEQKTTDSPAVKKDTGQKPVSAKKYTLRRGDRLITIALNEYGNKVFWVYLYEENKSIIQNPNNVPEGSVISIPPASKYGINKDDPASVRKASALLRQYSEKLMNN